MRLIDNRFCRLSDFSNNAKFNGNGMAHTQSSMRSAINTRVCRLSQSGCHIRPVMCETASSGASLQHNSSSLHTERVRMPIQQQRNAEGYSHGRKRQLKISAEFSSGVRCRHLPTTATQSTFVRWNRNVSGDDSFCRLHQICSNLERD